MEGNARVIAEDQKIQYTVAHQIYGEWRRWGSGGGGTDHALGKQIRCFTKKNYYGVYPKLSLNWGLI